MCGIAGFLSHTGSRDLGSVVRTFTNRLNHRGPDDQGWLSWNGDKISQGSDLIGIAPGFLVLVHRRLSILDLSPAGWQPMGSPDGFYYLVFNGEIYNYVELRNELIQLGHRFSSNSDTEVLLRALIQWDKDCFSRLVGMFSLAFLDLRQSRLILARDFFGIKPLYYSESPSQFVFASEMKALLGIPGIPLNIDPQRLFDYLRLGRTDHGSGTMVSAIKQLPAGHYLQLDFDNGLVHHPVPYWELQSQRTSSLSFSDAAEGVRQIFLDNVRLHLRSDVPLGAALSGGIDSSAIVAAMRSVEPNLDLHTFSYIADDPILSEERWVDLVAQRTNATLHKVRAEPNELLDDLNRLVELQDEPFGSTSIYAQYRVFRLARETGVTVMLDGQGADEILAGYRPYLSARLASLFRKGKLIEAFQLLWNLRKLPGMSSCIPTLLQMARLLFPSSLEAMARTILGDDLIPRWLNGYWFQERGVSFIQAHQTRSPDVLHEQLRLSLVETSLPMLLRYEDRNSMAWSIESRVPFLTPRFVEFVYQLPESYLIDREGTSKNVFRQAMRGLVPDEILDRKDKIGFATPEKKWLTLLRPWVESTLRSDTVRDIPAFNPRELIAEWEAVLAGRKRFDFRIWRWVNLIRWSERHSVRFETNRRTLAA